MNIIFDIDGTLMDIEHRRHFVNDGNTDWKSFQDPVVMENDTPNWPVVNIATMMNSTVANRVIMVSARNERHREVTMKQMEAVGLGNCFLFLRGDDDYRSDEVFKKDVLDGLIDNDIKPDLVFDDRNSVVDMWRRNGIPCFQVADGDF
jgi:hypothetical protein